MIDVESKMRKKKSFKNESIALFIVTIYMGMAVGHEYLNAEIDESTGGPNPFTVMIDTLERIEKNPFEIWPTSIGVVALFTLIALFGWSLMYQKYIENLRMRPGMENGTMEFETNYKKFNKKYLYDPEIILNLKKKTMSSIICTKLLLRRTYKSNDNITYMRRSFILKEELRECKENSIILSQNVYLSINTKFTQRNLNVIVLGGSGTGKSRFFVKPNILQANSSYVVTDPSGDIMADIGDYLEREKGYKVICFNIQDMLLSNRYNPFHYIKCNEDIPIMINCLMKNTDNGKQGGDPFWDRSETALLCACCGYLFEARPESERNFANVMKMLRMVKIDENGKNDKKNDLDLLFENWEKQYPESFAVKNYKTFKMAPGKTALSILITAGVRLGTFFDLEKVANLTSYDEMELEKIGNEKTALFIVTPQGDTTYSFLVSMLYTQLFETLYKVGEEKGKQTGNVSLDIPVRCLIDEFANVGKIPDFEIKLATMRKYNISACPVLQSLAQLKTMYEKEWEGIMGNCDTLLFLGGTEPSTLEMLSKKLGKETINTRNYTKNYSKQGGSSISRQNAARELMMAEEIGMMDNKQCLIFIRGCKPFCSIKYPYHTHPAYKYTAEKNHNHVYTIKIQDMEKRKIKLFENKNFISPFIQKKMIRDIEFYKLKFDQKSLILSMNGNKSISSDSDILDISLMDLKGNIVYENLFKPKGVSDRDVLSNLSIFPLMLESAATFKEQWKEIYDIISNTTLLVHNKSDCIELMESALRKNHLYNDYKDELNKLEESIIDINDIAKQIISLYSPVPSKSELCEKLDIEIEEESEIVRSSEANAILLSILIELEKQAPQINDNKELQEIKSKVSKETNQSPSVTINTEVQPAQKVLGNKIDEINLKAANNNEPTYEFEIPSNLVYFVPDIAKEKYTASDNEQENKYSEDSLDDSIVYNINGEYKKLLEEGAESDIENDNNITFFESLEKYMAQEFDDNDDSSADFDPDNVGEPEDSIFN